MNPARDGEQTGEAAAVQPPAARINASVHADTARREAAQHQAAASAATAGTAGVASSRRTVQERWPLQRGVLDAVVGHAERRIRGVARRG